MQAHSTKIDRMWRLIDWLDRLQVPANVCRRKARLVDWLDARRDRRVYGL